MGGGWPRVARIYPIPSGVRLIQATSRFRIGSLIFLGFTSILPLLFVTFWLPSANGGCSLRVLGSNILGVMRFLKLFLTGPG
jgi:hypothetical protein